MKTDDEAVARPEAGGARRPLRPVIDADERRALFQAGVDHFSRGEHFEAHECFEEIWRSSRPEPRDLFQGLVQIAAALHHFHVRQRPDVALRVLRRGMWRLSALPPICSGVDLAALRLEMAIWDEVFTGARPVPALPQLPILDPGDFAGS